MSDFLLGLSKNHLAKTLIRKTKLPVPLPPVLRRETAPWRHESLQGLTIGTRSGTAETLNTLLRDTGATISAQEGPFHGLLFDARNLVEMDQLSDLYEFFHTRLKQVVSGGKILILGTEVENSAVQEAVQNALRGFIKSLAKEVGDRGITVNGCFVQSEGSLGGIVRFFLSARSSFISGQILCLKQSGITSSRYEKLLEGRTIVVTGAAQGIGSFIARRAASEGAKVIGIDRPEEITALELLMREIDGTALAIDLLKPDSLSQVMKRLRELAPVHGVVHNAGITRDRKLVNMKSSHWQDVLRLNLAVPVALTQDMMGLEHNFVCAKDTSFVYLSSVGGIAGNVGQTNYAASKSGLIGYVSALAEESVFKNARFNCVAPGFIDTKMTQAMPFAIREIARRFNSLKQAGDPDDVAQAVVFLLSDVSSGISGEVIRVCGQNFVGA